MSPRKHRSLTIKQAKKEHRARPAIARLPSPERRRIEREILLEERASNIRNKDKKRREAARKRKEREDKKRELRKANGVSESTQLAGWSRSQLNSKRAMESWIAEGNKSEQTIIPGTPEYVVPNSQQTAQQTAQQITQQEFLSYDSIRMTQDGAEVSRNTSVDMLGYHRLLKLNNTNASGGAGPVRSQLTWEPTPHSQIESISTASTFKPIARPQLEIDSIASTLEPQPTRRLYIPNSSFDPISTDGNQMPTGAERNDPPTPHQLPAASQHEVDIPDDFWVSSTQLEREVYGEREMQPDYIPDEFWASGSQLHRDIYGEDHQSQSGQHADLPSSAQFASSIPLEDFEEAEARCHMDPHQQYNGGDAEHNGAGQAVRGHGNFNLHDLGLSTQILEQAVEESFSLDD